MIVQIFAQMLTREPKQMPNLTSSPSHTFRAARVVPPSAEPLSEPFFPTHITWEMRRRTYQPRPPDGLPGPGHKVCPRCWRAIPVTPSENIYYSAGGVADTRAAPAASSVGSARSR